MGYSTVAMDITSALHKVKQNRAEVDSASDIDLFQRYPSLREITSACKSDHGHIILNLSGGRFVDYKLPK